MATIAAPERTASRCRRRIIARAIALGLFFVAVVSGAPVRAEGNWLSWQWAATDAACGGDCSVVFYTGTFIENDMSTVFGLGGGGAEPFWEWDWEKSHLLAVAFSRRIATISGVLDVEPEIGIARRFGRMDETEVWGAVFFRWTHFPWNTFVKTSVAASTGLNYATGISALERARDRNANGSRLLHFFSPEITLAHPDFPNTELVLRLHHRSGGGRVIGHIDMFNGVASGAHHASIGLRVRF